MPNIAHACTAQRYMLFYISVLCNSAHAQAVGFRVTKLRITNIQNNTFFARIHVCSAGSGAEAREVDIDCRPSDGINLVRCLTCFAHS